MIDDKILTILHKSGTSIGEWDIARSLYLWDADGVRSKHGAWIRSIVQALWRLWKQGKVIYFFDSNGTHRYWAEITGGRYDRQRTDSNRQDY